MELPANEIATLKSMVSRWIAVDDPTNQQELEATFGAGGQVDATTFLAIAQRLQDRGFVPKQDDDRLSIITQKNIRISLQGIEILGAYCRSNTIVNIQGQAFSALRKHNNSEKDTLDIREYPVRLKSRREETIERSNPELQELFRTWPQQPKAFRLIKRWSFERDGMRIDMSIVRSTPKDAGGQYIWKREFLAPFRDGKTLFQQPHHYEVEVELIHGTEHTDTQEKATKSLIRGIGEVLRGMQGNSLLIRKSVQTKVLDDYRILNNGSPNFRGNQPVTLERKNMEEPVAKSATTEGGDGTDMEEEGMEGGAKDGAKKDGAKKEGVPRPIPNIRNNYNVTDKADGLRCLGFVNADGDLYLIDMSMRVYRTGLQNTACANSLVDGEWIQKDRDGVAMHQFGVFDIFKVGNTDVSKRPFATFTEGLVNREDEASRYGNMNLWLKRWNDKDHFRMIPGLTELSCLKVVVKTFYFATAAESIFQKCRLALEIPQVYHADGLILTPNTLPLPSIDSTFYEQFKWKPANDNTIDFLVTIEPLTHQGFHLDGSASPYKELILYVNARKDPAYDNPRKTVLYMLPLPKTVERDAVKQKVIYQPSQFVPTDPPDSMASRCYLDVKTYPGTGEEYVETEHGDPIPNNSIVEMRYDITQAPGRRWIPMRIRHDKTERYARAVAAKKGDLKRTLNSDIVANSIWSSIHNPITRSMICTGSMFPSEEEQKEATASRYYNRQASRDDLEVIRGLRAFHNKYIKQQVLYGSVMREPGVKILDLACGQAGDIHIWYERKASLVVGVDTAMEGLRDKKNGAYARYMNFMIQNGATNVPKMLFIHGDSSKSFTDGTAGIPLVPGSTEEGDMLITVLGTGLPKGKVPPYVSKEPTEGGVRGALREKADVASCMFALHYFFKNKETLDGFLQNLQDCVKMGGHFIACFTDGQKVFNMLRAEKKGVVVGIENKKPLWSIRRQYENLSEMPDGEESLGLPIDVTFISLGEEVHTEYLVSFPYLLQRLREYGFRLLNEEELKDAGLLHSTNTFDESYKMIPPKDQKNKYPMNPRVKAYSFTNRWLIVKRDEINEIVVPPEDDDGYGTSIIASIGQSDGAALADQENRVLGQLTEEEIEAREEAGREAVREASSAQSSKYTSYVPTAENLADPSFFGGGKNIWSHSSEYTPDTVFLFGPEASLTSNLLEREDKFYVRRLSPIWQFMIKEEGTEEEYPSLEHFWAAMKVLHAGKGSKTSLKILAASFTCDGAIHREAKERLAKEVKEKNALSTQNNHRMKIALDEYDKIRKAANTISYDDTKWVDLESKFLRYGLGQRWKHDVDFHKTVEELRQKNVYLLYSIGPHLGDSTGLFAGKVRKDGTINGDNLIGKTIMELARFKV